MDSTSDEYDFVVDSSDESDFEPDSSSSETISSSTSCSSSTTSDSTPVEYIFSSDSSSTNDEFYDVTNHTNSTAQEISNNSITEPPEIQELDDDVIFIPNHTETINNYPRSVAPDTINETIIVQDIYQSPTTSSTDVQASTVPQISSNQQIVKRSANVSDSQDEPSSKILCISCPICLESVIGKDPMSIVCGHIFCSICFRRAFRNDKKCPVCKRSLTDKSGFHSLFLGC